MRIVIKGADFSDVSIGKIIRDLSFRVCGASDSEEGVHGFINYSDGQVIKADATYEVIDGSVTAVSPVFRLITDYLPVVPGMEITFLGIKKSNTSTIIVPFVSCFDSSKTLLTDASTYAAYHPVCSV